MVGKKIWGNSCWFLFHVAALKLNPERTDMIQKLFNIIVYICRHLPCPICSQHAIKTLNNIKKEKIKTKQDLVLCLFQFHNIVNVRIKAPQFTIEEHNIKYENMQLPYVFNNWVFIMSKNLPGDRNMLYTMSRNNMIKDVLSFFVNNRSAFV